MKDFISRHKLLVQFITVLLVQLTLLSIQVKDRSGVSVFSNLITTILTPAQSATKMTVEWVGNLWNEYLYLRDLKDENTELKIKIRTLEHKLALKENLETRLQQLEQLLNFKLKQPFKTEAVVIIGTGSSLSNRILFGNKGSSAGLKKFQPVINQQGVVGKIIETTPLTSKIQLLIDPNSAVSVVGEESRTRGILRGIEDDLLEITYVDRLEKVVKGERVLTSGLDQIYPSGLLVGWIYDVSPKDELFLKISVKPSVDFKRIEDLLVIVDDSLSLLKKELISSQAEENTK